jgi:hypothetical protein
MFGFFQADIPIGNRLWLSLLALIVAGSMAGTPLALAKDDPVGVISDLLLMYGQATLIATFALALPLTPLMLLEDWIKERADRDKPRFYIETENYIPLWSRLTQFLILVFFLGAFVWTANGNFSRSVGALGLAFYLLAELLVEWRDVFLQGFEFLELRQSGLSDQPSPIEARLIVDGKEWQYSISSDRMYTLAYLGNNAWEIVDIIQMESELDSSIQATAESKPPSFLDCLLRSRHQPRKSVRTAQSETQTQWVALLRRSYRRDLVPRDWIEAITPRFLKRRSSRVPSDEEGVA